MLRCSCSDEVLIGPLRIRRARSASAVGREASRRLSWSDRRLRCSCSAATSTDPFSMRRPRSASAAGREASRRPSWSDRRLRCRCPAAAGKAGARGSETRVLGRESAEQKTLERALRVAMALRRSHCRAPLQSIDRGEARRGVRIKRDPILVEADVDREPFACRKGHTPGRGARARARTQTRANSRPRAREKTLPPRARARTRAASRADGVSEEAKKRANLFFGIAVNLIGLASRG